MPSKRTSSGLNARNQAKVRGDSLWTRLGKAGGAELRQECFRRLGEEMQGYDEVAAWLLTAHKVRTSATALGNFYGQNLLRHKIELADLRVAQLADLPQVRDLEEKKRAALLQQEYVKSLDDLSVKELAALRKLGHKDDELEQKRRELNLQEEKWRYGTAEAILAAVRANPSVIRDVLGAKDLTEKQRVEQLVMRLWGEKQEGGQAS